MNSGLVKVLMIDRDPSRRKERISVLQKRGYKVFPALDIQQAKERCRPGIYDLIVVNSSGQPEMALEFCDSITGKDPNQAVLLMVGEGVHLTRRENMVSDIPERLLEKVESICKRPDIAVKAA